MKLIGRHLALAWLIGATCVVVWSGWPAALAGSANSTGAVEWSARTGFYWTTDPRSDARLRLVSEDRVLLRAVAAALQELRLEAQHRLAWRLMAEVRAGTATQVGSQGNAEAGVLVDGGTVAVVAAEHALDVLAAIEPELVALVKARLEAAGRAHRPRPTRASNGSDGTTGPTARASAEAAGDATLAARGSTAGVGLRADVFAGVDAEMAGTSWAALALWGLAVLAAASGLSRADAAAAQGGTGEWTVRVAKIAGVARWRSGDEGPWRPLSVGMVLRSGDWVSTGPPGSLVELVYEAQGARVLVESETLRPQSQEGLRRFIEESQATPDWSQGLPGFESAGPEHGLPNGSPLSNGPPSLDGDGQGAGASIHLEARVGEATGMLGLDDAPGGVVPVLQGQAGPGSVPAQKGPGDAGDETADGGA